MKKNLIASAVAIALMSISLSVSAWTENPYGNSVGSDNILVYESHSTTTDSPTHEAWYQWDINTKGVAIYEDTASLREELGIYYGNQPDQSWDGYWTDNTSPDSITVNAKYWDTYNSWKRNSVVTHEFGHAFGLGDLTDDDPRVLMHDMTSERLYPDGKTIIAKPLQDDIDGFNFIWN